MAITDYLLESFECMSRDVRKTDAKLTDEANILIDQQHDLATDLRQAAVELTVAMLVTRRHRAIARDSTLSKGRIIKLLTAPIGINTDLFNSE